MEGKITIGRNSKDRITISIRDELSRLEFAHFDMALDAFAQALTGLSSVEGILTVRGLEHVGKQRVSERRSIQCPDLGYQKEAYVSWLLENAQEPGWIIDTYLGSQNSISRGPMGTTLNYSVRKYVEPEIAP